MQALLARLVVISLCSLAAVQAAPISLGFITMNRLGSGTFNHFQVNNWTGGVVSGYDIMSAVDLMNVSLTVDYAGLVNQPLSFSGPMTPRRQAYGSDGILSTLAITRAVFRADLNPAAVWTLRSGDTFIPQQSKLEMVLLPAIGGSLTTDIDAWEIIVGSLSDPTGVPEPGTWLLAAGGLLSVGLVRRRLSRTA